MPKDGPIRLSGNGEECPMMTKLALFTAAATAAGLAMVVAPTGAAAATRCTSPTFAYGQAQSVFSADPATWVRGEAWVQTPDDNDRDGRPDRVHVDITRPAETANPVCHYKAPVIFENSPYY